MFLDKQHKNLCITLEIMHSIHCMMSLQRRNSQLQRAQQIHEAFEKLDRLREEDQE